MTTEELRQLLEWRQIRGYKGLNLRNDNRAWVVNFDRGEKRTSKNFPFNADFNLHALWQLDEACAFVEGLGVKSQLDIKMFGESRVSRIRKKMVDGNDLEGVFLEHHRNDSYRLSVTLNLGGRVKLHIPKKMSNQTSLSWALAFGRQLRALSFYQRGNTLSEEEIKIIWKDFIQEIRNNGLLFKPDSFEHSVK